MRKGPGQGDSAQGFLREKSCCAMGLQRPPSHFAKDGYHGLHLELGGMGVGGSPQRLPGDLGNELQISEEAGQR